MPTSFFRKVTVACSLALAIAAHAPESRAQDALPTGPAAPAAPQPIATIAIASYDRLLQDADFLGSLVGMQGASQMLNAHVAEMTGGAGLAGLDTTKPIGLVASMGPGSLNAAAYLPVTDQNALLAALKPLGVDGQAFDETVTQVSVHGQDAYAQTANGWMLVALSPDGLKTMPADPSEALVALTQQHDVAIQINMQNIPVPMQQQAIAMMGVMGASMPKAPNESDEEFKSRQQLLVSQIERTKQVMRETDQINLGLTISGEEQKAYLDVIFTAVPGTPMAAEMAERAGLTTNFAGFNQDDAACVLAYSGKVSGARVEAAQKFFDQFTAKVSAAIERQAKEEQRGPVREAIGEFVAAIANTIKAGTVDGGLVLHAGEDNLTGVAGGLVTEPAKIEAGLHKLADALANSGGDELPPISWAAETHNDVTFHTMQIPMDDEEAKALFGDNLNVVVGLGPQSAYIAWGRDASDSLKKVIDGSAASPGQATIPFKFTVCATHVLDAVKASVKDDRRAVLEMISQVLGQAGSMDHLNVVAQPIENGLQVRIELEQGVLRAIAMSSMMKGMSGGQTAPAVEDAPVAEPAPAAAGQ